ncbi:DUF4062 domain-containing protein [Cyanobium sp. LEGE 06143]|uniref:DUF4062 domain-containing protein n=1 Tax=Cyanobium sp. LEGE 06143 TaxID=945727 RepID=UPI00187EAC73|nr:DUF4062 domain-containing protein [Cyanobium sp. LEGE 06143]MBE9173002.1 DUF4062 domain-containing protein [Cyanobium sp. LEGE 06143]MBE9173154.1 DUF4062 domain-containing protein [Cyanobium sp. LEGE 06143]
MDKRYQVFVSSTFIDLQEERRQVIQTVMELDCFPAGMELFPAADEEQWDFIRKVIDDCDYYILILGGRYGSLTDEGISYTGKEYDYAVEQGLPVLGFLHENPDEIPLARSEIDPETRQKLAQFRSKVASGRLVRFWKTADSLPGLVALSLNRTIKTYPRNGWLKATAFPSAETLAELNDLRKRLAQAQSELEEARKAVSHTQSITDLAPLDKSFTVKGEYYTQNGKSSWSTRLTWLELFTIIAPTLLIATADGKVSFHLAELLLARTGKKGRTASIDDSVFDTIKVQFLAHGLIVVQTLNLKGGGVALFWGLTKYGHSVMLQERSVKQNSQDSESETGV